MCETKDAQVKCYNSGKVLVIKRFLAVSTVHRETEQVNVFFFFKQKTAYEMLRSLVGSEMCIRDSELQGGVPGGVDGAGHHPGVKIVGDLDPGFRQVHICLLYTSDAADDLLCVDLGGRRIIKKKKVYQ